jgi:ubiquinone biosynthesis protein UbiJ
MITPMISTMINAALASDPDTAEKLNKHHLKKMRINLLPLKISFLCEIKENKIALSTLNDQQPLDSVDAEITGTPLNLLSLLLNKNQKLDQLKNIKITGDVLWVQELEKIFSSLNIDLEEKLSHLIGDTAAYTVFQGASSIKQFFTNTCKRNAANLKEYLEDEKRLVVSRIETRDFCNDVDDLRHQLERLEAKINLFIIQVET